MKTRSSQYNAIEEAVEEFYRDNPSREVKDTNKTLGELLLPVLGSVGVAKYLKETKKYPSLKRPGAVGLAAGLLAGVPYSLVSSGARRKKILEEKGIKTNLIGSYAEPTGKRGEKYFK